jgi:tartrate-resistant acid phosphatase type 5
MLSVALGGATLAPPGGAQPVSPEALFAVIGDYGYAGQPELDVSNLIKGWNPEFIVTVGDNNYTAGAAATIDPNIGQCFHEFISPYTGSYGAGATVNRFFPALGNHDWDSGLTPGCQPYLDYFALPGNERYYEFSWGPVHLCMVDSDSREPDGYTSASAQATWLQTRLRASGDPWHFVLLHHAPYSSSSSHGSQIDLQWPYRPWGAQAILSGHDHTYERLLVGGLPYMVNGLGGRSTYAFGPPVAGSIVTYSADYGAQRVAADPDSVRFQFFNRAGALIDTLDLTPWRLDGDPEPNLDPIAVNGLSLHAHRVGDWLYVATDSAQGTGDDHFVYVARSPGALQPAGGAKGGQVAAWDLFLMENGASSEWFDASGAALPASAEFESVTGTGTLVEGAFNMRAAWGSVPASVFLCAAAYASPDGGALDTAKQVPAPASPDADIQASEFMEYVLPPAVAEPLSPWKINGQLEVGLSSVAVNGSQELWVAQQGEWLYVAATATPASPSTNDLFIYVSRTPGALQAPAWAKAGQVPAWDYVLAREGASTFNSWYDAQEDQYLRVSRFHSGVEDGQALEGSFNMVQAWGAIPASVFLAVGEYGTSDGGALVTARQVPGPVVDDDTIQTSELFEYPLITVPAELVRFGTD